MRCLISIDHRELLVVSDDFLDAAVAHSITNIWNDSDMMLMPHIFDPQLYSIFPEYSEYTHRVLAPDVLAQDELVKMNMEFAISEI